MSRAELRSRLTEDRLEGRAARLLRKDPQPPVGTAEQKRTNRGGGHFPSAAKNPRPLFLASFLANEILPANDRIAIHPRRGTNLPVRAM